MEGEAAPQRRVRVPLLEQDHLVLLHRRVVVPWQPNLKFIPPLHFLQSVKIRCLLISFLGGKRYKYRGEKKSLQILLSSTMAGPGREVKQEQEISPNHVQAISGASVFSLPYRMGMDVKR